MRNLLIIVSIIVLEACNDAEIPDRQLVTVRFCDSISTYNVIVKNSSYKKIKALYLVYIDMNNNKVIDSKDKMFYRSPILVLTPYEERVPEPVPIDTLWNSYTLLTELQTTLGEVVKDHLYPCERHVTQLATKQLPN